MVFSVNRLFGFILGYLNLILFLCYLLLCYSVRNIKYSAFSLVCMNTNDYIRNFYLYRKLDESAEFY